ncbi:MAG: sugar transferase [Bacteroidales bacterium]|nr:sugar transferase [Bacteroidales bacterium]MCF8328473.1 sugar transferase [Bacteroidales bacterium]
MWSKTVFDRIFSLIGLIVCIPLFLVIGILIKIKMPGPVFFKQKRVGQHGKLFRMWKFRSMRKSSPDTTVTTSQDARITPLGSKLRKYKLDELPELWNILKGDMSFVGPRPDVPGYADQLQGEDRLILEMKPGITGPASLKYANEEELLGKVENPQKYNDEVIYPDKVRINLDYYKNWSFSSDILIIWKTITRKY